MPYQKLAGDLRALSGAMQGAIAQVGYSMPPAVGDQFVGAMRLFVDDNGVNHLFRLADELERTGERQVDRSRKLAEGKYEILIEFSLMNLELALIAALSVFTGGTSFAEAAMVRARTALSIILAMQRLGRAAPMPFTAVLEAFEEAFTSFFAQFLSMTVPDSPDRRRTKFDWQDVGRSALVGFIASVFGGALGEVYGKYVAKHFKDRHWLKEGSEVPFAFVNEGQAEVFAMGMDKLIFEGRFAVSGRDFWMSGVSGGLTAGAEIAVGAAGLGLYHQFFQKTSLNDSSFGGKPGVVDVADAVRDNSRHPLAVGDWEGGQFRVSPELLGAGGGVSLGVPDSRRPVVTLSSPDALVVPPVPEDPEIPGQLGSEGGFGGVATAGSLPGGAGGLTDAPPFPSDLSYVIDVSDQSSVSSDVGDLSDQSSVFSDAGGLSDGASVFSVVSDGSSFSDVEGDFVPAPGSGTDSGSGFVRGAGVPAAGVDGTVGATGMFDRSSLPGVTDAGQESWPAGGRAGVGGSTGVDGEVRSPVPSRAGAQDSTVERVQPQDGPENVLDGSHRVGQDTPVGTSTLHTPTLSGTPGVSPGAGSAELSRTGNPVSATDPETRRQPAAPQQDGERETGPQDTQDVDTATDTADAQGVDTDVDTAALQGQEDADTAEPGFTPAPSASATPVAPLTSTPATPGQPVAPAQSTSTPATPSQATLATPAQGAPPTPTPARTGTRTETGTGVAQATVDTTATGSSTAAASTASAPVPSVGPPSAAALASGLQRPDGQSGTGTPTASGGTRTTVAPSSATATTRAAAIGTAGGGPAPQAAPGVTGPSVGSTPPRIVVEPVTIATRSGALPAQGQSAAGGDGEPAPRSRSRQSQAAPPSPNPSGGGRAKSRWDAPEAVAQEITDSSGRRIGVMSFNANDLKDRKDVYGKLAAQKSYVQWRLDDQKQKVGEWRDLPQGFGESFFLALHHDTKGFHVVGPDGRSRVWTAEELGRELDTFKNDLSDFKQITLLSCTAGADPTTANRTQPDAQTIADITGWTVNAPAGEVTFIGSEDHDPRVHLQYDADGKPTAWRTFHPRSKSATTRDTTGLRNTAGGTTPDTTPYPPRGWNNSNTAATNFLSTVKRVVASAADGARARSVGRDDGGQSAAWVAPTQAPHPAPASTSVEPTLPQTAPQPPLPEAQAADRKPLSDHTPVPAVPAVPAELPQPAASADEPVGSVKSRRSSAISPPNVDSLRPHGTNLPEETFTPRFGAYYGMPQWQQYNEEHEKAIGWVLAKEPVVIQHARAAVGRLYAHLTSRHGLVKARQAFFPEHRDGADTQQAMRRLLDQHSDASLSELMTAFANAAYANPSHHYTLSGVLSGHEKRPRARGKRAFKYITALPSTIRRLWSSRRGAGIRAGAAMASRPELARARDTEWLAEMRDRRGLRVGPNTAAVVKWLVAAHQWLNVPGSDQLLFRQALMGWLLPLGEHSLFDILEASHQAGMRDVTEPDLSRIDAVRLHGWADGNLDPHGLLDNSDVRQRIKVDKRAALEESLIPPHQRMYLARTTWLTSDVTGEGADAAVIARIDLRGPVSSEFHSVWRGRRQALHDWLLHHDDIELLRKNTKTAYVHALYLISGPDAWLLSERFGRGEEGRRLLTVRARVVVKDAFAAADRSPEGDLRSLLPLLFLRDERFRELTRQIGELADQATPGEPGTALTELRRALTERAEQLAEVLGEEPEALGEHREMAAEALGMLPPVASAVYWSSQETYSPAEGARLTLPRFHWATTRFETARAQALARGADGHPVIWEAEHATGRDISPFSRIPGEGTVRYADPVTFEVVARERRLDASGQPYAYIRVREVAAPLHRQLWQREIITRPIVGDGRLVGQASLHERDWFEMGRPLRKLPDAQSYHTYWPRPGGGDDRSTDPDEPVPWGENVYHFAAHGRPAYVVTVSPAGLRSVSLYEAGVYLRNVLRDQQIPPETELVLQSCHLGAGPGIQQVADRVGRVTYGTPDDVFVGDDNGQRLLLRQRLYEPKATWQVRRPGERSGSAGQSPPGPADQSVWASVYAASDWPELARRYEDALGRVLAADPRTLGDVRDVIRWAFDAYQNTLGGPDAARGKFFAPNPPETIDYPAAFDRLLDENSGVTLHELMTAVSHGLLGKSPDLLSDTTSLSPQTVEMDQDERGLVIIFDQQRLSFDLFHAYERLLQHAPVRGRAAIVSAVTAWLLPDNTASLYAVMEAANVVFDSKQAVAASAAVAADAAHLYEWVDRVYAPRSLNPGELLDRLIPPHLAAYGNLAGPAALPATDGQVLSSHEAAALRLLAGADAQLLDTRFTGGARGRTRLAEQIRSAVLGGIGADGTWPTLLMRDAAFQSQAEQTTAALTAEGTLSETDPAVMALLRRAGELVGTVQAQIPAHLAMAARALRALPAVAAPVWWGTWAPGPPDGDAPAPDTITVARFQPGSLNQPTALNTMAAGGPRPTGHHLVLVEVADSSARDISSFTDLARMGQARYADDAVLDVLHRELRQNSLTGERYEHLLVREKGRPDPDISANDGPAGDGPSPKGPDASGPDSSGRGGPGPQGPGNGGAGPDPAAPEPQADSSASVDPAPTSSQQTDLDQPTAQDQLHDELPSHLLRGTLRQRGEAIAQILLSGRPAGLRGGAPRTPGGGSPVPGGQGARPPAAPYRSADELLADLRASVIAPPHVRRPEEDTYLLGPDLFGTRWPAPPPGFLAGHDFTSLAGGQAITFLRRLDVALEAPSHTEMAPAKLAEDERVWVTERSDPELRAWAGRADLPPLPATTETPALLHYIWLGGQAQLFRESLEWTASNYRDLQFVLWTDIPRADFDRAKALGQAWDSPRLADVGNMLSWAAPRNIVVVNVDEVFNAQSPMLLHEFYKAESAKQTGPGHAAASDILRLEVTRRFGGVYLDGDNAFHDPSSLTEVLDSREGYAIDHDKNTGSIGNSSLAMSMNHPFAAVYLDEMKKRYSKSQRDLMPPDIHSADSTYLATPQGRIRRNTAVLNSVALRIGIDPADYPSLPGVIATSALTWLDKPEPAPQGAPAPGHPETLRTAQLLIQSLVRDLYNRDGDLHLTAADQALHGHPQRDLLWEAALAFIAQWPELASKAVTLTLHRADGDSWHQVRLPAAAAAWLDFDTPAAVGEHPTMWLGEYQTPVRLRPPFRPHTPAAPSGGPAVATPLPDTEATTPAAFASLPAPTPIPTITVTPPLEELPTIVVTPPINDVSERGQRPEAIPQPEPEPASALIPESEQPSTPVPDPAPLPESDPEPAPAPVVSAPARLLSTPVLRFGTRRDGAQELAHVTPVPQATVEWLQERSIELVEDGRGPDPTFRAAVRRVLTARLLSAEWARLFSTAGLPLNVTYRRQRHPVSLRLGLTALGPSPQQLDPMPDGPPVSIQRWTFGINEAGDTGGSGDLRGFGHPFSHTWTVDKGPLRRITLTPQIRLTYNQLTTSVTVGTTVQPMVLIRSKGRHWPFDYAMNWELRRNDVPIGSPLGTLPDLGWESVPGTPDNLLVWFPTYLSTSEKLPDADPARPETVPAPLDRLLDEMPLFGPKALADHDVLFADVLRSFADQFASLSDGSRRELFEFFGEGNHRGNLPQAWGGSVASPTLYTASGETIGYLRISAELTSGNTITGPTTASSVLETYVLRSMRMQGNAQISNGAGLNLSVTFGFAAGAPDTLTGVEPIGGQLTFQFGAQHQFAHALNSGGSARIAHSLRTGTPLLNVTPRMQLHVTLVRPDSAPLSPATGSPLADCRQYPVDMLVPSLDALGHMPVQTRYLPPEVLHLKQLGVSTTPLQVSGTELLFDQAERWLRDNGLLPSDRPGPRQWDRVTEQAARTQRLNNLRKLDQMRSRLGLRSALDEMVEGGDTTWFELPGPLGTRRVSVRLVAERRYIGQDANTGVDHQRTFPKIQTLNYTGSTITGDEQFQSTPFAWNVGGDAAVSNPFDVNGDQRLRQIRPQYSYTSQTTRITGAGAGTGHEYYMLSPTENGIQAFSVPVTYRMEISDSHGPNPEPGSADGSVRLAVPTYRTLDRPSCAPRPGPAEVRDHRHQDDRMLNLPNPGRTLQEGVLRLPETAWLDRVDGSADLRREVLDMIKDIEREATEQAERYVMPPTPGGWVEEDGENRDDLEAQDTTTGPPPPALATRTPATAGTDADGTGAVGAPAVPQAAARWWPSSLLRATGGLIAGSAHWVGGRTADAGRWVWRAAVGEPATDRESLANEVADTALSPHHLSANALRIFRDSYVIESAATPGALAGTDFTIEVKGYLTDVRVLPQPPKLDAERWLQSTDASASTENRQSGHQGGLSLAGRYGGRNSAFEPQGGLQARVARTDGVTVNDNTGVFRVTTEDTTPAYRFTAKAHYVVTVRSGARNVVSGTVAPGQGGLDRTRVVELPEGVEFLLVDNDPQNHPDLAALVAEAGQTSLPANPSNHRLPSWYIDSGGTIGAGAVTEVHTAGGRGSFQRRIHRLVQQDAPGVTTPGHAAYVPGVLTRINEHATSLGLRALVNAGPRGHTAFHFVHRSWLGPRLVEVALVARPAPCQDLSARRGKRVTATSGMDNVFGHSHGDGTALEVPGATRTSSTRTFGMQADFSPLGERDGEQARPTLSLARQSNRLDAQNSSREMRSWQRTFGNTTEFSVPYEYEVRVSSRPLTESLFGRLINVIGTGLDLAKDVFVLPRTRADVLPAPRTGRREVEPATTVLRFNASEAPDEGERRAASVRPAVFETDPSIPRPAPAASSMAVEMEVPADLRALLSGPAWVPPRPIEIYDFGGVHELGEALRAVDHSLKGTSGPKTTMSAEGMFIRLTTLAQSNRLTRLEPAAVAPFLGHPGGTGISAKITLYSPRTEVTSKDTAIDRIELSADGFQTQADNTITPSLGYNHSSRYSYSSADRGGPTVPVAGDHATLGQNATSSSQRRELLRIGTPMANAKGEGLVGHRVRAVALLEVHGPQGARWVAGDVLFRTTETPPETDLSDQTGRTERTEQPEGTGQSRRTEQAEQTPHPESAEQNHKAEQAEPAEQQASPETDPEPDPTTFVTDRPVPRYDGGHRLLTAYQWAHLDSLRLAPRDVYGDGDCFFRALLEVAGDKLRQRTGATDRTGMDELIATMRAQTAEELTTHQDRYADHIGGEATDTSVRRLAADIRKHKNFANLAGDVTPWLAAERFGLRLTLVEPDGWVSVMGPEEGTPVTLMHITDSPLHFLPAVPTAPAPVPTPMPEATSASAAEPVPASPTPGTSLTQTVFEVLCGTAATGSTDTNPDDTRSRPHPAEDGSPGR
ncbi:hypothetical protein [Streptomyces sp. NBC_01320]|uniref:hypothetical protein n=1 Tax=Streptomyces sp. NBC_01320 TaxID=2903824 RepID=UPI002E0D50AE|nr:hypothetical protein OG395_57050 [Streptomyces sp. NBC_01320]